MMLEVGTVTESVLKLKSSISFFREAELMLLATPLPGWKVIFQNSVLLRSFFDLFAINTSQSEPPDDNAPFKGHLKGTQIICRNAPDKVLHISSCEGKVARKPCQAAASPEDRNIQQDRRTTASLPMLAMLMLATS